MARRIASWRPLQVALAANRRFRHDGGPQLTAAMAYYAFLSVFPLILVGLSAVGFVLAGDAAARADWAARLSRAVPGLGPLVSDNIDAIVSRRSGAGIAGAAGLLWTGTGLANSAGYALARIFRRNRATGFVRKKVWSVGVTVLLGSVALPGVAASGVAGGAGSRGPAGAALAVTGVVVAFALDGALFLLAYRVLVPGWGPRFRRLWPGALLAAAGWTALKFAGAWYAATTVARASEVYGTFATVVGVLVLLYLASRLFLYGAELDVVLAGGGEDTSNEERRQIDNGRTPSRPSIPELVGGIASDVSTRQHGRSRSTSDRPERS